jgi:uncharacterized protein YukE
MDSARRGFANLVARIRACTGQTLAFDFTSELFREWGGATFIKHKTAVEDYPEKIQELNEKAYNKLVERNECLTKINNLERMVELLMFMMQQTRHTAKQEKQNMQEVDRSRKRTRSRRTPWMASGHHLCSTIPS